jgi:hypothetical protein
VSTLLLVGNLLVLALGLYIAGQAFLGYRRNGNPMMLAIGAGFVFLSAGGAMGCSMFELLNVSVPGQQYLKTCLVGTGMAVISLPLLR